MILAQVGSTGYNILLFLHIAAIAVALSPTFVHPFLARDTNGEYSVRRTLYTGIAKRSMRIYGSSLIVGGLLGFGVAGLSDKVYQLSDGWLAASVIAWLAMNGALHAMVIPAEKAMADGDEPDARKAETGSLIISLLFLLSLYLMIFKPGA
ncbi:MAG: hypothetical protein OXN44_06755 [Acidimicrobiaceae bacterium]|nr:hypothetical protein [Acidimicrobiaceae bacterium]